MRFVLDGARIADRAALHRALAEGLRFPEWYGGNLDALHDCLTDISKPVEIEIRNTRALEAALGGYARAFRRALTDSAAENENLRVSFREADGSPLLI